MNYEEMSDEEINFEVFHKDAGEHWDRELFAKVWNLLTEKYDYCNSPPMRGLLLWKTGLL